MPSERIESNMMLPKELRNSLKINMMLRIDKLRKLSNKILL